MIFDKVVKLLPEQYKSAVNLNKLLSIVGDEVDELITAINQVKVAFYIESAIGSQLDVIGIKVVLDRNGLNDTDYREALTFKIFQNVSKARVEDLIFILKTITQGDVIVYTDDAPAAYTIYTNGTVEEGNLNELMDKLSGAGVSVIVKVSPGDTPLIFPPIFTEFKTLKDNNGNNIITDTGLNIIVNAIDDTGVSQDILDLFQGEGMGVVGTNTLTDNNSNNIVTDTGLQIITVDTSADPDIDGGLLPITFE